jgi:prepilin-type N-terminal cleavage/methylation domain-containing protein/prepilin-type processing-associated H-X9-DG protein
MKTRRKPVPASFRGAFTIVELMVVIAILGLLLSLLIPAVQSAREAGRRTQCLNHLHQLGTALAGYEASRGMFPAGENSFVWRRRRANPSPSSGPTGFVRRYSVHVMLLPYLDHGVEYNRIDFKHNVYVAGDPRESVLPPLNASIPEFRCPSDSVDWGTNYRACVGAEANQIGGPSQLRAGVFSLDVEPGRRLAEVTDGASHTAAMSESIKSAGRIGVFSAGDPVYTGIDVITGYPLSTAELKNACEALTPTGSESYPYGGWAWAQAGYFHTWYNHASPPNGRMNNCVSIPPVPLEHPVGPVSHSLQKASSRHGAGVHVLLVDGSVRWISSDVSDVLWKNLATIHGSEATGGD